VGKDGRVVVKGKRREMNRVAAKRHREKNKDRLKSVSLHIIQDAAQEMMRLYNRQRAVADPLIIEFEIDAQLEKRKVWLDHAVAEYEKSNKRLTETLDRLKRENMMVSFPCPRLPLCFAILPLVLWRAVPPDGEVTVQWVWIGN
jgi:hypothetical protein